MAGGGRVRGLVRTKPKQASGKKTNYLARFIRNPMMGHRVKVDGARVNPSVNNIKFDTGEFASFYAQESFVSDGYSLFKEGGHIADDSALVL